MASPNFQPSTRSHHARVADGSALASSVCVMTPIRLGGAAFAAATFLGGAFRAGFAAGLGRRAADFFFTTFFFAAFFDFFLVDLALAMGSLSSKRVAGCAAGRFTSLRGAIVYHPPPDRGEP